MTQARQFQPDVWKPGRTFQCEGDGYIAFITQNLNKAGEVAFPIIGVVLGPDGKAFRASWTRLGSYWNTDRITSNLDLTLTTGPRW